MKNKLPEIYFLCAVFAMYADDLSAYYATALTVTEIERSLAKRMETRASALLTELNGAFFSRKDPQLAKIGGMSLYAQKSILAMWKTTPFRCIETEVIECCHKTPTGYQVRNIPLFLMGLPEDEAEKDIVFNFDKSGRIEDVYFSVESNIYRTIMMSEHNDTMDEDCRKRILSFVENLHTAYYRKDTGLIAKVYIDDILIIAGKAVKRIRRGEFSERFVTYEHKPDYSVQSKKEYVEKLRRIFKNNSKINMKFGYIEVVRHPKYPDIYGVGLLQGWNVARYSDTGYLFLIIDFHSGENMKILVRTWQPDKMNGRQLSEDEKYRLGDFDIRGYKGIVTK
jgi:hypothetical protein